MTDTMIVREVKALIARFGTRDPFEIAEALHIKLIFGDYRRQKGACNHFLGHSFIYINMNLSEDMQRFICAHELIHLLFHEEVYSRAKPVMEFELFDMTDRLEVEANAGAVTLLVDDGDILDFAADGYDIMQMSRMLHLNVNATMMKLLMMNADGYNFNIPRTVNSRFLGSCEDNAGEL